MAIWEDVFVLPEFFDYAVHAVGVPVLAFGYACLIVWMCGATRWSRLASIFTPVGRMALSAYVAHGALILLFAHPFGLYVRPALSPALSWVVAIGVCAGFAILCRAWLTVFRFGPLEWLWRSLTYGKMQPILIKSARRTP